MHVPFCRFSVSAFSFGTEQNALPRQSSCVEYELQPCLSTEKLQARKVAPADLLSTAPDKHNLYKSTTYNRLKFHIQKSVTEQMN